MPSAKGKPTDPKLKEKVTEEVKQQTNKDGSGKGQMAAWKAAKIGKEYEARGGDYDNEPGSKDKPEKGPPQKKSEAQKKSEMDATNEEDSDAEPKTKGKGKGAAKTKGKEKKEVKEKSASKEKKEPKEGERKSSRQAGKKAEEHELPGRERTKRKSLDEGEMEEEQEPAAKKGKAATGKAKK